MKIAYIVTVVICAVGAFPKEYAELEYKRLYIDPQSDVPGRAPPGVRIVNGHEAVPHSIPYQAYVIISSDYGSWLCGGVLISTKYVLTAGHCIEGGRSALVYLGAHDIDYKEATQARVASSRFILHGGYYEYTAFNDIGLIELVEAVKLNTVVGLAQLPRRGSNDTIFKGEAARVSGWGYTKGSGSLSSVLLEANDKIIDNVLCNAFYGIVKESQLCTGGVGGVSSCGGDSGGPLVIDNVVVGIVSYSVRGCVAGFPSGYTRISSFLDWIESNTDVVL